MKNVLYFSALLMIFNSTINSQTGTDTIEVSVGWNLIGSLSTGTIIDIISTEPPGIIEGSIFGYVPGGGYYQADTLNRGKGYWVKVSQNGMIIIELNPFDNCGTVNYDGKIYNTVLIETQCWLKENLDVGTMIPGIQDQGNNSVIEKYCYDNDPANCNTYGGLYQWNEAMQYILTPGSQGICPPGWHIPTITEFQTLANAVGNDGNALKAVGQGIGGGAGTNTSGFSALLAGYRNDIGFFNDLGVTAVYWSSSEVGSNYANFLSLNLNGNFILLSDFNKDNGFSVRCLKD
ncbi:MAG: hypothetical protein OEM46_03890 [Ignavibacteria bacterium]|nr:hypothetical protein [Ignavibacteria bacterium]